MSDYLKYRFLEIVPGFLVWATFLFSILLSIFKPLWLIYFIIIFDLYWLFRVSYFIFYLLIAGWRLRCSLKVSWFEKLQKEAPAWENKYHLIFLPTAKEPAEVIDATFQSLTETRYPLDKFIVVLCGEERGGRKRFLSIAGQIQSKFGRKFKHLLVTVHPADLPGEIPGKGSNLNYAGHLAKGLIDKLKIPYEDIIVSSFDVDTRVHPEYFSLLTYLYCTVEKPTRASFQPVALYNNNIWQSNPLLRVTAFGTTFWIMTELERPDRLFTFSSHSMSFKALVEVGFWQKNIVTEDSRIFLQCFLRYGGDYRVVPLYLPVSMYTAKGDTFWDSVKNLYKQQRRWAWGVEHFPFMVWHFRRHKHIPWRKKIKYLFNLGEGMYSWASVPLLIFLLGRLPLYFAPEMVRATALYQNTPFTLETLMNLAMAGILVSAVFSLFLLPRPPRSSSWNYPLMILQWALLPITLILFGSLPAIDAQTRLMFGRYLGFYVTKKKI
ncbi:MAG: glycosyltransferase family 2 protein [Candidatus Magasanikbacteria bacterium]|nr:glycosyltransferase family 2 protein [Candidatus Magasanikbacteria bacterium]